jgi:PTS system beta-glucosides-specific IIA component
LDTVNLKGKGFKVEVKEDELVKKGQTLLHFDKDYIEKEGYSTEVLMVVTDCPNKEVTTNTTNPIITIQ